MGLERATLSNVRARAASPRRCCSSSSPLLAAQNTYLERFQAVASPAQRQLLRESLASRWWQGGGHGDAGPWTRRPAGSGVDAEAWFAPSTDKIGLLKEIEDRLYLQLFERSSRCGQTAPARLVGGRLACCCASSHHLRLLAGGAGSTSELR